MNMRALLLALFIVGCTSTRAEEPAVITLTLEEAQAIANGFSEMGATILLLQKQVEHYRIKSGCV